jgi:hypothetical protein
MLKDNYEICPLVGMLPLRTTLRKSINHKTNRIYQYTRTEQLQPIARVGAAHPTHHINKRDNTVLQFDTRRNDLS